MTQALKTIGAFVITFAVIGGVMTFFGLPLSSTATVAGSSTAFAVFISPEELTRAAGPMPVQEIENYQ